MTDNTMKSPIEYVKTAFIAQDASAEIMSRLTFMNIQPSVILDLGCGTGELSVLLRKYYPTATVIALDIAENALHYAKVETFNAQPIHLLGSDAHHIALRSQTVDLIIGNMLLPWQSNSNALLRECKRLLRPQGLCFFTALGPTTLQEWPKTHASAVVPQLIDMHDLGDLFGHLGLADPVLETMYYTVTYEEKEKLLHELYYSDIINQQTSIPSQTNYTLTFEVIYAHAWQAPQASSYAADEQGVATVPLASLRERLRRLR